MPSHINNAISKTTSLSGGKSDTCIFSENQRKLSATFQTVAKWQQQGYLTPALAQSI
jgi:hypothetical protein